jgi:amino acid transporter
MEEQDTINRSSIHTPIQSMVKNTQKDSTVGPMIGSIIVIITIVVGGLYFLGSFILNKKTEIKAGQIQQEQADTLQVEQTAKQSASDDVKSIESDIKATNIDTIDKGLSDIDKEF